MNRVRGLILAIALAAPGIALAQTPTQAQSDAIRSACRADYESHCAAVPPGGAASLACLQQNAPSLSPSCRKAVDAVSAAPAAAPLPPQAKQAPLSPRQEVGLVRQACAADYRAYCPGLRPGGGRATFCLKDHGPQLSPSCRHALMSVEQPR